MEGATEEKSRNEMRVATLLNGIATLYGSGLKQTVKMNMYIKHGGVH